MPELAARLRALHVPGDPLLLLNAWDAASARVVAAAGLPAVATTSSGLARALGHDDGQDAPVDEVLAVVRRVVAAVPGVPVTADLEAGYGLEPADLAERLLATGAVGCNLEDTDHAAGGGALRDAEQHAAYLAGRARGGARPRPQRPRRRPPPRRRGSPAGRLGAALDRARRYADAGADCVYPIALGDEAALEAFVARAGVPVNALLDARLAAARAPGRARGRARQRRRRALRGRPAAARGARRPPPRRATRRRSPTTDGVALPARGAARPARHAVRRARPRRRRRARDAGRVGARRRARPGSSRWRRRASRPRSTRPSATRSSAACARVCADRGARAARRRRDERHPHDDRAARAAGRRARRRRVARGGPVLRAALGGRASSPTSRPWRRARRCRSSSTTSRTAPAAASGAAALLELADVDGVAGLKQAVGALDADTLEVLAGAGDRLAVLGGDDPFLLPVVLMGGTGAIAASSHLCTARFAAMLAHGARRRGGRGPRPRGGAAGARPGAVLRALPRRPEGGAARGGPPPHARTSGCPWPTRRRGATARALQAARDRPHRADVRSSGARSPALHRLRRGQRAHRLRPHGAAGGVRARPAGHGPEGVRRAARAARAPRGHRRRDARRGRPRAGLPRAARDPPLPRRDGPARARPRRPRPRPLRRRRGARLDRRARRRRAARATSRRCRASAR